MKRSNYLTIWELVLLLASILVFRSGWLLLDQIAFASSTSALVLLLVIGFVVSIIALKAINKE